MPAHADHVYIVPVSKDVKVADPSMQGTPAYFLPLEGRLVSWDSYWSRRVRDGEVEIVEGPPTDSPAPA